MKSLKKIKQETLTWQPVFFFDLMIPMPSNWHFDVDNGIITAKHIEDEIRVKIVGHKIDQEDNEILHNTLQSLQYKYVNAGYHPYEKMQEHTSYLLQKLALDDEPCCVIAAMKKHTKNGTFVLSFSFTSYDRVELNPHLNEIYYMLDNVAVRLT